MPSIQKNNVISGSFIPVHSILSANRLSQRSYRKLFVGKKWILLGLFLSIVTGTAVVNLLKDNIYRGEFIINMWASGYGDIVGRINNSDKEEMVRILPETHSYLPEIKINFLDDGSAAEKKIQILIDAKDTTAVNLIASEVIESIGNFPSYKNAVEQRKEEIQKELDVVLRNINTYEEILATNHSLLTGSKIIILGFNPLEPYDSLCILAGKKFLAEQALKSHNDVEIIDRYVSSEPVKSQIMMNTGLSVLIAIIACIFYILITDVTQKRAK